MALHPEIERLADMVAEIASLCAADGASHWAEYMHRNEAALRNSDAWGLHRLVRSYGGMGSFNDLVLDDRDLNERLSELRAKAYELARRLKQNASGI